ncbi:excinuclease ABC subunit UvrA [Candidatus Parcubacteria bacterium]|nr:excinuclease ABC subunit UvrA [Candidatus Parcubacteria bacterium]
MSPKKPQKNIRKDEKIVIKGARTHNLKNVNLEIPRNKMVIFTGLSGSGKSSLAFDTIFAEGQRRYVESLSAYARQFLNKMQKPDVDEIQGLSPAISIDQKSRSNNPRSTVATITEIYDYLRILFARVGRPHCMECGREIKKLSKEEILNTVLDQVKEITSKTSKKIMDVDIDHDTLQIYSPVVVGRKGEYYQLLYDMLAKGYQRAKIDGKVYSLRDKIILSKTKKHNIDILVDELYLSEIKSKTDDVKERLSEAIENAIEMSEGLLKIITNDEERLISSKFMCPYDGFSFPEIEPRLFSFNSPHGACPECNGLGTKHLFGDDPCSVCEGKRLRPEAMHVLLPNTKTNIDDVTKLSVKYAIDFFLELELNKNEKEIANVVMKEITERLEFMNNVGIEYLTLNRRAHTLSGGEAQRIRLASQLGSGLVGATYVLDEPTIGLHSRDNDKLVQTLLDLRDAGNTIIVVEHDEDTIYAGDYLVDIGPGAGVHGGEIVVSDDMQKLLSAKTNPSKSSTLDYLRGDKQIEIPEKRRSQDKGKIQIKGGNIFNIKNMNVDIPLGKLTTVTGVSGSGKSSFVYEILYKNLRNRFDRRYRSDVLENCSSLTGTEYLGRAILIDQSPIGRTPRSNPATYTGAFTFIRELFAETAEARVRGWSPSRFSFNVKGGRCEACQGNGYLAVEMHFLPTVYVPCDICEGKRFMKETLEIDYKKKNIFDVLKMTVEEALAFFEDIPAIYDRLKSLDDVGLGYLELGQSATTLSGGEAQRVKIASELYRAHLQKTIYILDEPTIGLHYDDVKKLIEILQKLVDKGNTVLVIEHNMDLIKSSDYIIDIGPEGGENGGQVMVKGTPEQVADSNKGYTAEYLKKALKRNKK